MSTDFFAEPDAWISQAEAARIRGVSRQAISRLVKKGRVRSASIGGRLFVLRKDVEDFQALAAGRPVRRGGE